MKPATPTQREAYDACLAVARTMQAGLEPTPAQLERIRAALARLEAEPQPPGFVESLRLALGAFVPELRP